MTDVAGVVNKTLLDDRKSNVYVYSGTYDGKEAVNKYIIIKDDNEKSFYELSLEIYNELNERCVGICKLLNYNFFGENPRTLRISMENCGVDLFHYIKGLNLSNKPDIEILLKIAHDVLSAIICLNRMNLVHGDIKSENITITGDSPNNVEAKLIDLDSIGYVEKKASTKRHDLKFGVFEFYNIPIKWVPLAANLPKIKLGSTLPLVIDPKLVHCIRYIDIFSWCDLFLSILPITPLSSSSSYIKAYMFVSLLSDMDLPDIKKDAIPKDTTSGIVIDVEYCEKVKSFLLWLKGVNTDILSFPKKDRKKWWASFKKKWWTTTAVNLAGEPLGGGYNKSNHKRSIRKNKHCLSKRLKKRKYKRTHKRKYKCRKYKRTHKCKYKKQII
jgi:serine/threonine protein kinase